MTDTSVSNSNTRILWAFFFLLMGMTWIVTLWQRNAHHFPEGQSYFKTYQIDAVNWVKMKKEMQETLKAAQQRAQQKLPESQKLKPVHISFLWSLAFMEMFVALFYFFAGITLLRRYSFSRRLVLMTVGLDLIFKIFVGLCFLYVALPLQTTYQGRNLVLRYFVPDQELWTRLSQYFSGLIFFEPYGWVYGLIFLGYVVLTMQNFCRKA